MDDPRRRYDASCTLGLEQVLADEVVALGGEDVDARRGGVRFRGSAELGWKACLWLRSATRLQLGLARRPVHDERSYYEFVRDLEWERWLTADGTLAVHASVNSSFLTHSRYAAQLTKDAVVDRFRDRTGRRPSVDTADPDLPIRLHLDRDVATLYLDLGGLSLHKRGYRDALHKSPLNEALAAGLLLATGWDRSTPLADPMAGSGTFGVEAAWIAGDVAPRLARGFAFERWPDLDRDAWAAIYDDAEARREAGGERIPPIFLADAHPAACGMARRAAKVAGVGAHVTVEQADAARWEPRVAPGLVVSNPPYGERLGRGSEVEAAWRALGNFLHRQSGATAWLLSGNPETTRFLGLRATEKLPVRNGPIDCRFVRYDIREQSE